MGPVRGVGVPAVARRVGMGVVSPSLFWKKYTVHPHQNQNQTRTRVTAARDQRWPLLISPQTAGAS